MTQKRQVEVFTGHGKGKTTAALGRAVWAVLEGSRVCMVQFLKAPDSTGEHYSAELWPDFLTIKPMGRKGFIRGERGSKKDCLMAEQALREAQEAIQGGLYDLVILDEVNMAIHKHLIVLEDLLRVLDEIPQGVRVVLTGREARPEIVDRADAAMEMRNRKHYFEAGLAAQIGIEY